MTTLRITRGLPGSGKTTVAEQLARQHGAVLAARDDIRAMLFPGRHQDYYQASREVYASRERDVTLVQEAAVTALLRAGRDVIVHDTNLPDQAVETWRRLAAECGAVLEVIDLRHVPLDVCIARDAARCAAGGRMVGADVIKAMQTAGQRVLIPQAPPFPADNDVAVC